METWISPSHAGNYTAHPSGHDWSRFLGLQQMARRSTTEDSSGVTSNIRYLRPGKWPLKHPQEDLESGTRLDSQREGNVKMRRQWVPSPQWVRPSLHLGTHLNFIPFLLPSFVKWDSGFSSREWMLFPIYYIGAFKTPTANTVFRLLVQGQILLVWGHEGYGGEDLGLWMYFFPSQDSWLRNFISEFF